MQINNTKNQQKIAEFPNRTKPNQTEYPVDVLYSNPYCFSKILYARHYVWKDFVSPPLDSYLTGHKNSLKKAQADNTWVENKA